MKKDEMSMSRNIRTYVDRASNIVSPFWPLTSFIACNALKGMESIHFEHAMRQAESAFGARGFLELSEYRAMYELGRINACDLDEAFANGDGCEASCRADEPPVPTILDLLDESVEVGILKTINRQMIKWCSSYFDKTQATFSRTRKRGLFNYWKELALHDHSMWVNGFGGWRQRLERLPETAAEALSLALQALGLEGNDIACYLERHIVHLPGWASYIKWSQVENGESDALLDYLTIRLLYELHVAEVFANRLFQTNDLVLLRKSLEGARAAKTYKRVSKPLGDYAGVWQSAYEINYRNKLISAITTNIPAATPSHAEPSCQIVFCIDVRSEPIRTQLEKVGAYSTFGFAGFFGIPMRLNQVGSSVPVDLCPVLIKPKRQVYERGEDEIIRRIIDWQSLVSSALYLRKQLKCNIAGAFGLVEMTGLWSGFPLFCKTLLPGIFDRAMSTLKRFISGDATTSLDVSEFCVDEKLALAQGVIEGIGFDEFSSVIVLCGHRSSSVNNPYASSLDCGACGGNGGGYSARLAVRFLNDETIRVELRQKGIDIPDETVFIAAEHNTTTDSFQFYDLPNLSAHQQAIFNGLQADLAVAGERVRTKRQETLPKSCLQSLNDPLVRGRDWAQVAPEWGLAGNATFIAAPRSLTKGLDLDGRAFLHSYDCHKDSDGKVLELIMTAPLVVASWINLQYYLSTVDNRVFGSGSKVVHNVVGDFGVMQGACGDLRIGLPLQSIVDARGIRRHEPMRLLALIKASRVAIDTVLASHPEINQLVKNRWIRLVAVEPQTGDFFQADEAKVWRPIEVMNESFVERRSELIAHLGHAMR